MDGVNTCTRLIPHQCPRPNIIERSQLLKIFDKATWLWVGQLRHSKVNRFTGSRVDKAGTFRS